MKRFTFVREHNGVSKVNIDDANIETNKTIFPPNLKERKCLKQKFCFHIKIFILTLIFLHHHGQNFHRLGNLSSSK